MGTVLDQTPILWTEHIAMSLRQMSDSDPELVIEYLDTYSPAANPTLHLGVGVGVVVFCKCSRYRDYMQMTTCRVGNSFHSISRHGIIGSEAIPKVQRNFMSSTRLTYD